MRMVIELKDGKVETLFTPRDFEYLLERYMGYEAVSYFRQLIDELEEHHTERVEELTVELNDLREKISSIQEVCRE